ncbi:MAG TPA: hemerythrin domain-containing protein [Caldimonas sp.]|nr:hemerythrin domain-containing protein [Caldimonas sp.]
MPDFVDKDALELLDADHLAVKHLFVAYARLTYAPDSEASGERAAIAAKICDELTVHAQIEEEIFYPALRDAVPEAADVVAEAEDEHRQAKLLIAQVREHRGVADGGMDQLVADLARVIEDHVKEERDELFPKARSAPTLDLASLGVQLKERQLALAQQQPEAAGARSWHR